MGSNVAQLENESDGLASTPALSLHSLNVLNRVSYTVSPTKQFGHVITDVVSSIYLHGFGQKRGRISSYPEGTKTTCVWSSECHKHNPFIFQFDKFQPLVDEPKNLIKQNCELFEKLGEYGFQNA